MNVYFIFLAILTTISFYYFNSVEAIVGAEGVSLHELTSIEKFKCLKENLSVEFVIVQASRYNGLIDPNAINNILNALAAGIGDVDIYIYPCVKPKAYDRHTTCGDARQELNK